MVQALEAYLAELEAGGTPDRDALLTEYADVAGPLADCLDGLDLLHTAATPADDDLLPVSAGDDRLGDFRLVREIGRGGMGVVYEAVQESLGRRVAVKTLPAAAGLAAGDLRRFQHEARTAALLQHPHIVPVFAVGFDRGTHFFAMRLVEGRSLAELIERPRPGRSTRPHPDPLAVTRAEGALPPITVADPAGPWPDLPDDPRFLAGLALQAADALQHAHAAGVVHRDIKPANLLLDETGHLWVADFGLAYLPGASRHTRPGARVGTLLYMAPEQARGEPADHRADLYGLGATLYELLTRRPVVDASDHRTAVARILTEAPVPPRTLAPGVPRDLETVVLKLLAKEPHDRYPTAAALADDLRRFLAGKPVLACRPSLADHAARWVGRHRRPVAAVAAAVLLLAGWEAVSLHRLTRERDEKLLERQQARAAVDDLYTEFAERWLAHQPRAGQREREFLRKAQAHYDRLAQIAGGPRTDRLAAAVARRRVADIDARLGDLAAADAAYTAAGEQLRQLVDEDGGWTEAVREAAICATDHGNLLRTLDRPNDAGRQYAAAAAGFRTLADAGSVDPFDRAGLAGVETDQGLLWHRLGRPAEAEACHRSARAKFARLAGEFPAEPAWVGETAGCAHNLADVLAATARDDEAERTYREALVLRQRAAELAPDLPAHRRELARARTALAALLRRRGHADAAPTAAAAVAGWERLAADFPDHPEYADDLARARQLAGPIGGRP